MRPYLLWTIQTLSAALSLAERDREFAATSASDAVTRLLGQDLEARGPFGRRRERGERPLDDPVLEGVEGDDDEARSRARAGSHALEELAEPFELSVDLDAQGLEGLGGGVDLALLGAPPVDLLDETAELARGLERMELAPRDDLAGEPPGMGKLAVGPEHLVQPGLGIFFQDGGGGRLRPPVHAHIERAVGVEAESALRRVELERRDPQVEEHAADLAEVESRARGSP